MKYYKLPENPIGLTKLTLDSIPIILYKNHNRYLELNDTTITSYLNGTQQHHIQVYKLPQNKINVEKELKYMPDKQKCKAFRLPQNNNTFKVLLVWDYFIEFLNEYGLVLTIRINPERIKLFNLAAKTTEATTVWTVE